MDLCGAGGGWGCGRLGLLAGRPVWVVVVVPREALNVKKLLALAVAAGGVFFVLRRKSAAKAEADLWREATAPAGDAKK